MKPDKPRKARSDDTARSANTKTAEKTPRARRSTKGDASPPAAVALQAEILLEASRLGLVPLTTQGSAAILEIVDNLSPAAYEAMHALALSNPDAFLKHYLAMAEFKMPKLARVEHKVEGQVEMAHFVAVERREERPAPARLAPAGALIDAEVVG